MQKTIAEVKNTFEGILIFYPQDCDVYLSTQTPPKMSVRVFFEKRYFGESMSADHVRGKQISVLMGNIL